MNKDTPELESCEIKALLEIARNLTRERDAALKRFNSSQRARKSLSDACDFLQAKQDATERLVRELRDALQRVADNGHAEDCLLLNRANAECDCGVDAAYLLITKTNQLLP